MKSFDDILDESVKFGDSQRFCFEKGFEAGQQSKQAEVDELQKRIDEVLDYVGTDFEDYYTGVMTESIHEILKGNANDH